jgi:hypothetical protein
LYGRLSLLNPELSKQYLLRDPRAIKSICLTLRTREVVPITSDAFRYTFLLFRGLILTFKMFSQPEIILLEEHWACVLDAIICYPIRDDPSPANSELLAVIVSWVQQLYRQVGVERWNRIL